MQGLGTATIGGNVPVGGADPGGWFNTEACDAGISVVKGTPVSGVRMPVYWPPTTNNYDMKNLWWSVVPSAASNRPYRKGLPVGLSLRSQPASGSDDISDLFLEGTVSAGSGRHRPRAGTYKVDIRWNWLKTSSEQGERGFRTYTDCKIKVIESRPEAPACPKVRKFRKGDYTSVRLSYGDQVSLSRSIPGMTVVRDGRSWNLQGVPSRAGTYSARLVREGVNWSVQSGVCVFTVHTRPPVTVTAVDTSITEGNAGSSTVYQYLDGTLGGLRGKFVSVSSDPPWNQARSWHQRRGWASVKLSRAVEDGEPRFISQFGPGPGSRGLSVPPPGLRTDPYRRNPKRIRGP